MKPVISASAQTRRPPRLGGTAEVLIRPGKIEPIALAVLPAAPLDARIDGVETAGGLPIKEIEVNEPGLFLPRAPAAADRFAEALLGRL